MINLTEKQTTILAGLRNLGEDLEQFYLEGINIYKSNSLLKAHYLAHTAREIDSMIRDTFSTDTRKNELKKRTDYKNKYGDQGLVASILASLGIEEETVFAKKWHSVSDEFHRVAHRDRQSKKPRPEAEGTLLWDQYEDILLELVGSYFSIKKVLDNSLNFTNVSSRDKDGEIQVHDLIDRFSYLFNNKQYRFYFFNELESKEWLEALYEKGFFNPETILSPLPVSGEEAIATPNWVEGKYLIKVAKANAKRKKEKVFSILNKIINEFLLKAPNINNFSAHQYIGELICLVPEDNTLLENRVNHIEEQLEGQNYLVNIIVDEYIPFLLNNSAYTILETVIFTLVKPKKIVNSAEYTDDYIELFGSLPLDDPRDYLTPLTANHNLKFFTHVAEFYKVYGDSLTRKLIEILSSYPTVLVEEINITRISHKEETYFYPDSPFLPILRTVLLVLEQDISQVSKLHGVLIKTNNLALDKVFLGLLYDNFTDLKLHFLANLSYYLNNPQLYQDITFLLQKHIQEITLEEAGGLIEAINSMYADLDWPNTDWQYVEKEEAKARQIVPLLTLLKAKFPGLVEKVLSEWIKKIPDRKGISEPSSEASVIPQPPNLAEMDLASIMQILANNAGITYEYQIRLENLFFDDVLSNTEKYFSDINTLLRIPYNYLPLLINAINVLAEKNSFVDWTALIDFSHKLFTTNKIHDSNSDLNQYIIKIAQLFTRKMHNKDTAINVELAPSVIRLFLDLFTSLSPEISTLKGLSNRINNSRYSNVLDVILIAALHWGRNQNIKKEDKLLLEIKQLISNLLINSESIELHYILGIKLSNFAYLDFDWYLQILPKIFPEDDTFWYSSFVAYLNRDHYVHPQPFQRLIAQYERAIYNSNIIKNQDAVGIIIHHAIENYFFETANNTDTGLLEKIIRTASIELLDPLARFMRTEIIQFTINNEEKLRNIWDLLYQVVEPLEASSKKDFILATLGNWINQFSKLDQDIINQLTISFKSKYGLDREAFMKALLGHLALNPQAVTEILKQFCKQFDENYPATAYGMSQLPLIIDQLYKMGHTLEADQLCDCFGRLGFDSIGYIYDRYHRK